MHAVLYHELAEFYDRIYAGKDYRQEARWLEGVARRHLLSKGRRLLDVACGTGRHLGEFRGRFDVTGVDASPEMLAVARKRLGPGVPLVLGDMRTFRVRRQFDVLVCLFSAIGYMPTRRARDQTLANFYRHVAPGGVALVEGWVRPERWRGKTVHLDTYDGPEAKIARLSRSSRRGRRSEVEMHYLVGQPGKPVRHRVERHRNPLVSVEEMLRSFRKAGFRARAILSEPYRDRGLYLGVRPTPARPSSPSERVARKGHHSSTMGDAESLVVAEKRQGGAVNRERSAEARLNRGY